MTGTLGPRRLLLAAAVLALVSLGLPWGVADVPAVAPSAAPTTEPLVPYGIPFSLPAPDSGREAEGMLAVTGASDSVRVLGLAAAGGLWLALRRRSVSLAWAALVLGAVALPLGAPTGAVPAGRLVYAVALGLAAVELLRWQRGLAAGSTGADGHPGPGGMRSAAAP